MFQNCPASFNKITPIKNHGSFNNNIDGSNVDHSSFKNVKNLIRNFDGSTITKDNGSRPEDYYHKGLLDLHDTIDA